jgi:hypothetical protein
MSPPPGTLSAALTALWTDIATHHDDLPTVAVVALSSTATPTAHPPERWGMTPDGALTGLTISVETLTSGGAQTVAYLLHEAAHVLCWRRGVKDTSSGGIYHNTRFMAAAEEVGLTWPSGVERSPRRGLDAPVMSPATAAQWSDHYAGLEEVITTTVPYLATPDRARQRPAPVLVECSCSPPRKVRVSATALSLGPILCGVCRESFAPTA